MVKGHFIGCGQYGCNFLPFLTGVFLFCLFYIAVEDHSPRVLQSPIQWSRKGKKYWLEGGGGGGGLRF